ncbi:head-tail adaptor protein [Stappia stellulata]|uniref:phage head completion protein n=1 Tax=Stappia stellulata TaxID=71235 RepID=UPI001CD45A78|nr:head-tail adaptor protein [Stappia stellulata]MCA1241379.1 head-tail adaptor protein [Stappia stellulata]
MSAADELDRAMRLSRPDRIEAADGEAETVFTDVGLVFVALAPASLAERQVSGRLGGVATHVARLRSGTAIAGGWRLAEGMRAFRVLAVDDASRRSGLVTCVLEEETA